MWSIFQRIKEKFLVWFDDSGQEMINQYGADLVHDVKDFATQVVKDITSGKFGKVGNKKAQGIAFSEVKKYMIKTGKGVVKDRDTGLDTFIMMIVHLVLWVVKQGKK